MISRILRHGGPGFILFSAFAVETACQVVRTVVLARLLHPSEFGLAVAMALVAAIVEMVSGGGAERFLTYAKDGGRRRVLATMHILWMGRGFGAGLLMLALAWPAAWALDAPHAWQSFAILALAPVLRCAANLRPIQWQRIGRYGPDAAAVMAAALLGVLAAIGGALLFGDHRAMVLSLIVSAAGYATATRIISWRVGRLLAWHPEVARRAMAFGMPLLLNGLALQALGQLDRLFVGILLGAAALGLYSPAMMLLMLPGSLIARVAVSLWQPKLSASLHRQELAAFERRFRTIDLGLAGCAVALSVGWLLGGAFALQLLLGPAYRLDHWTCALLAMGLVWRLGRYSLNLRALALGQTGLITRANLIAAALLPFTALALWLHPQFYVAAAGFAVAELLGYGVTFLLLCRVAPSLPPRILLWWGGAMLLLSASLILAWLGRAGTLPG